MRQRLSLLLVLFITLIATAAQPAMPLAAQGCSNEAELVEQISDPAATTMAPDAEFTVSWTLRNEGDCTWDRTYRLIFVEGERMDSSRTSRLRTEVEPGESVTLSVDLTAPAEAGSHSGTWQLRAPDGDNFGPELVVEIEVAEGAAASTDVVLPEVLVFGGGEGGDENLLVYCLDDGELPNSPTLVVDDVYLSNRGAFLYLCTFPEGAEITLELTDPNGNTFSRTFVEDAPVTGLDEDGNELTGSVLQVNLAWIKQAPEGDWTATVTAEDQDFSDETVLSVPANTPDSGEENYPLLDNWPTAPIDPFSATEGCHYAYTPGQEMMLGGQYLSPDTLLNLGIYQTRLTNGYFIAQESVQTDEDGAFEMPYNAPTTPGNYELVLLQNVNPEGYSEDGTAFEFGFGGGDSTTACFTVLPEEEDAIPLRLAFGSGTLESSKIVVLNIDTGKGYYPVFTDDVCNATEPAWWPGGEWVLYQSNCVSEETDEGTVVSAGGNYDLYASMIDQTYTLPEEETLSRLTETPELDETEPDANLDGLIVYRQTPAGTSLDESGELWLMDLDEGSTTPLGISGRAPTWSPDGSRIAYMSDEDGTWQIYVYDLEDDEQWLVSEGCDTHCRMPAWSPDGKQLLYQHAVSLDDPTPDSVWMVRVESGTPRRWLSGLYGRPSWSSEGRIALQGADGIYLSTTGRRPTVERYLYPNPEEKIFWAPVWSR